MCSNVQSIVYRQYILLQQPDRFAGQIPAPVWKASHYLQGLAPSHPRLFGISEPSTVSVCVLQDPSAAPQTAAGAGRRRRFGISGVFTDDFIDLDLPHM